MAFHYNIFHGKFSFQPYACNGFHNVLQTAVGFIDVAIVWVKNVYRIHFWNMSKNEAINLLRTFDLNEK